MTTVVCGAGGFIGGHLVASLRERGEDVRGVDIKPLDDWWQRFDDIENVSADLRDPAAARAAVSSARFVYNLACDMGGMGFIENNRAACMVSVLINTNLLCAARDQGVEKHLFTSSACVYRADAQDRPDAPPLREEDAYPAMPEDGYGWEKLFGERMCRHFHEDHGLDVRVVRLHNVYGPHGSWTGGREKAPAALCRKVIEARQRGVDHLEIWGDGSRTRTFLWIGDCIEGLHRVWESDVREPLNVGSTEVVSIEQLARIVQRIAGVELRHVYRTDQPQGVHGRAPDNTRLMAATGGWAPGTPLEDGLRRTYEWIESRCLAQTLTHPSGNRSSTR